MTKPAAYRASVYAWMIPRLTEIAREHGYALGVHGSMHRDLDLIAVPWVDGAKAPDVLIESLRVACEGTIIESGTKGGRWDAEKKDFVEAIIENPSRKPHGRLAWNIHLDCGPFIDISVFPPTVQPDVGRRRMSNLEGNQEYCPDCDGCGWYEGGEAIQTTCNKCSGTGIVTPA